MSVHSTCRPDALPKGTRMQRKRVRCARALIMALALAGSTTGCAGLSPLDYPRREVSLGVGPVGIVDSPMTLPRYLGVDIVCERTALLARHTREKVAVFLPFAEPTSIAVPLSHPDNAMSPSPTIANVHKLKQQQAENGVKVKAVGVLATLGCAADPHVEEGLLAALDDPCADVRIAAVEAVLKSTRGCRNECQGCCSALIRVKLTAMVFERSINGCWAEPNPKARRLARLALDACGGPFESSCETCTTTSDVPLESPSSAVMSGM